MTPMDISTLRGIICRLASSRRVQATIFDHAGGGLAGAWVPVGNWVPPPPPPDFTISTSGTTTAVAGGSASYTVTAAPVNGFSGTVNLTASGLPGGAYAT